MTHSLQGLLRLQERLVKSAQKDLGDETAERARIDRLKDELALRKARENAAVRPADFTLPLEAWRQRIRSENLALAEERAEAEARIEAKRDVLRERTADKLVVEKISQRIEAERARMLALREQNEMDDIAAGRSNASSVRGTANGRRQ